MDVFRSLAIIPAFTGLDGAIIREVAGRSHGMTSHSLAVIIHPPGTESVAHHHTVADEVYLVWSGTGRISVDGVTQEVSRGDVIVIRPGQQHKLWNAGPEDLVLVVTCAPAYDMAEVAWDE